MGAMGLGRVALSAFTKQFGYELARIVADEPPTPQKFSFNDPILQSAEAHASSGDFDKAFRALRQMSLADFGWLLMAPPPEFRALTAMLPKMASKEVQRQWTGSDGPDLLLQSLLFVKSIEAVFPRVTGRPLHDATILDFGCGWGRLIRLMLWFSDPKNIYGVDAWNKSLEVCDRDRVPGNLARSDTIPDNLPFDDSSFDLIYAFSVFTHLSERPMMAAQRAIRAKIKSDGIFVITVRPPEYWGDDPVSSDPQKYQDVLRSHKERGFAYVPHQDLPKIDGEVMYGDTSITLDYIRANWKSWNICGHDHNFVDRHQIIVFLKPV